MQRNRLVPLQGLPSIKGAQHYILAGKKRIDHRSAVLVRLETGMSYMDAPVVGDVHVVKDYSV